MKILHVLNHSVPHIDGYSIRSSNIVRFQRALGWEPVVVTSPYQEPTPTELEEVIDGVRYYRILNVPAVRTPYLGEIRGVLQLRKRLREVMQREKPDIIHAHSPSLWGAAAYLAARGRVPLVYEMRSLWQGSNERQLKYRLGRVLETFVARRANAVSVISVHLCQELTSRGIPRSKLFIVPNGVDSSRFVPRPPDLALSRSLGLEGKAVVAYLGSFYFWEGVEDLVRAARSILRSAPNTAILIVGSGEADESIRRLIAQLGLQGQVHAVGAVEHHAVPRYYSIMDVIVYPRQRNRITENVTPLKPLEAMCMGKAIVCSDVGGLRELLPEDSGLYFRSGDPEDLAQKCLVLLSDAAQRAQMGCQLREHAIRTRDWSNVIENYRKVYEYALGRTGRGAAEAE